MRMVGFLPAAVAHQARRGAGADSAAAVRPAELPGVRAAWAIRSVGRSALSSVSTITYLNQ